MKTRAEIREEISTINRKIGKLSIPRLLGGQTFKDQTGFGSEYNGEYLVYQGKNYGETTKFLIIGVIVE